MWIWKEEEVPSSCLPTCRIFDCVWHCKFSQLFLISCLELDTRRVIWVKRLNYPGPVVGMELDTMKHIILEYILGHSCFNVDYWNGLTPKRFEKFFQLQAPNWNHFELIGLDGWCDHFYPGAIAALAPETMSSDVKRWECHCENCNGECIAMESR